MGTAAPLGDVRFDVALYTPRQAARYVDVPESTFKTWLLGYERTRPKGRPTVAPPILTSFPVASTRLPSIPFVGLVEGLVLAAVRRSGVPMQRIRPALEQLKKEIGVEHALASKRLYTDGAEVLFDIAEKSRDADLDLVKMLVVVRNGQRVFTEVVRDYLQRIQYDRGDGFARLVRLPAYEHAEVVVDPGRSFGQPIFARGGARVGDVLDRFWTGESLDELTEEFGVPEPDLEDAVRVASRGAA